jgi:hypothetical protein
MQQADHLPVEIIQETRVSLESTMKELEQQMDDVVTEQEPSVYEIPVNRHTLDLGIPQIRT